MPNNCRGTLMLGKPSMKTLIIAVPVSISPEAVGMMEMVMAAIHDHGTVGIVQDEEP